MLSDISQDSLPESWCPRFFLGVNRGWVTGLSYSISSPHRNQMDTAKSKALGTLNTLAL